MRPTQHKKALTRFAVAASAAAVVPAVVVVSGVAAMPVALTVGAVVGLLGLSVLEAPRRRVTSRARG